MKQKYFLIAVATAGLMLNACGKVKDAIEGTSNRAAAPGLMDTWGSQKCRGVDLKVAGISERTYFQFSGKSLTQVHEFYDDGKCGHAIARVEYRGDLDVQGDAVVPGAKNLKLHFDNAKVVALDDSGKKLVVAAFCGDSSWATGQAYDVTTKGRGLTCNLKTLPTNEFNIEKVDHDTLYFGKVGFTDDVKDEAQRPKSLDTDVPFSKVNRDFN